MLEVADEYLTIRPATQRNQMALLYSGERPKNAYGFVRNRAPGKSRECPRPWALAT